MAFGKSIRIFLKDGTVTGMKFGEVVNHTIQSVSCPRLKANELSQLPEARRPGVYFLFGKNEETNEDMVYIGEAENVLDRLQNHLLNKNFWNEVIFFISKDENLTKAHVKYLESRCIQIAYMTKRCKIENANQPQLPALPLADRDAMEEFLLQVKMLVGIFGYKILENIIQFIPQVQNSLPKIEEKVIVSASSSLEFFLSVSGISATAIQTNEGIVVLSGSYAAADVKKSLRIGYRDQRQKLIDSQSLKLYGDKYKFEKEVLFSSPSAAGAIIVGSSFNGAEGWKDKNGKSLKEIEQEKIRESKQMNFDNNNPTI